MTARGEAVRLLVGHVAHERLRPARHAFRYSLLQIACDVERIGTSSSIWFGADHRRPLGIATRDYGPCDGSPLGPWMRARLAEAGIPADGEIWLQTIPRVCGYAFNPVSFWYCHDREGRLRALYADVRNTFGGRHGYLLSAPDHAPIDRTTTLTCRKTFHVSPFCAIAGEYRFRVVRGDGRWAVSIDYSDADGLLLRTRLAMHELHETRAWWRFAWQPFDAIGTLWRIHWQALALALRRVPFHGKTPPLRATLADTPDDAVHERRAIDTPSPTSPYDARP
jgi:uncharacterized protein